MKAGVDHPRLVVFDFDNTLYGGDSGTQFVGWLLRRNWWRMIVALLISPVIAPLWLDTRGRRRAISAYLWIGSVGLRQGEMDSVVDRYATIRLRWLNSRLRPRGVDTLEMYRHGGDHVVVVTGAPFELVRTILATELRNRVPVVGSTSRRFMGGLVLDQHCYGPQKLVLLCDAGYTAPVDIAYGDNVMDLPLLTHAAKPIVVNPRVRDLPAFHKTLGKNVEIQDWCRRR
ncbi:haloacid dehalogenase-like hydrolase [Mycobacterium intracellulare]|uniref:Haloacid dehalogenase-like hydrolase n=1 Tax=Mycobacterium intracellulare TaxID=1767 RepID=A0AAE4RFQ5_MYCIT|nr:haloacid dehalogenase-like hydrolase [Mycobacterium intracellulare]MCA2320443.1 haloacid dehalogenase-like hydrolase [Mycobacterium intracellulare]MCA2340893.1 haloacid dehalogenase-like hydrolase [Mycobacterium intracellulare]MDV6979056.1 haloacid dehalogenase-like hydrolase [Mycobacterium intracellulare]MDV6984362.1 haloacid dehalogenase-like hydrolase [Mycobacterium intracellulare]MDV7014072.1 haloacid dehalogenase-like hydrolase [Mycobacterium intracellulare]